MERRFTFRQMVVLLLALWYDLGREEVAKRAGYTEDQVWQFLRRMRKREIDDETYGRLLSAVSRRPAEEPLTRAFVEALDGLDQEGELTEEERASIEESVLQGSRLMRRYLTAAALRSRTFRLPGRYPLEIDLAVCRHYAGRQVEALRKIDRRSRLAVVRLGREYHHWALVERCCEESVLEASSNLKQASAWARLAVVAARFVTGPKRWRDRVQAYALAHVANVLRVQGRLQEADACMEEAKALWKKGADPGGVLDPGRLLDLEGALRRDQRRFDEALSLFDLAIPASRFPERALMMKGTTFDVMGDYGQAIKAYFEARLWVERRDDPRLENILRLNLASVLCHVSRYGEAAELVEEVRRNPDGLGKIDFVRVLWLDGRILAGLNNPWEARRLLAEARQKFAAEAMFYDVALTLLEESALLLVEGRAGEVKALALELAAVFDTQDVHPEALNALQIFEAAVQQEKATTDLARRVLRFLFKARHDQGLRFES